MATPRQKKWRGFSIRRVPETPKRIARDFAARQKRYRQRTLASYPPACCPSFTSAEMNVARSFSPTSERPCGSYCDHLPSHRASVQFHWFQNAFFHHGQHIPGHDWRLFAHEQVQSERRRSTLRHAGLHALCKLHGKRSASALLRNTESGVLQRVTIVFHFADKARLFGQSPRYRIADRAIPDAHDIECREESSRLQHPSHFPENASLIRNVHAHMNHVGTVEGVSFERQLESAALSKFR